jgi:hypothetical protein
MPPRSRTPRAPKSKEKAPEPSQVDTAKFHPFLVEIVTRMATIDQLGQSCIPLDADSCHYEFYTSKDCEKASEAGFPTAHLAISQMLFPHTKPNDDTAPQHKQPPPDVRVIYIPERRRELYKELDRAALSPRQIGTIGMALRTSPFVQFPAVEFANAICVGASAVRTMFEPFARLILTTVPHVHIDAMLLYMLLFIKPGDIANKARNAGYWLEDNVWDRRRSDALKALRDNDNDEGKSRMQVEAEIEADLQERSKILRAIRDNITALLTEPIEIEDDFEEKPEPVEKEKDADVKETAAVEAILIEDD